MADIIPFRAWRYDFKRAGAPHDLLAPPFDVITPERAEELRRHSAYNITHLILGAPPREGTHSPEAYESAARKLREWQASGILQRDPEPSLYPYQQQFTGPDGRHRQRFGFVAALRLAPFEDGVVLPHEETFARPIDDRVNLMRACRANLSLIFALYRDEARVAERTLTAAIQAGADKLFEFQDPAGVTHRMFRVSDRGVSERVAARLAQRPLIIADGHHRYTACLRLAEELRRSAGGVVRGPWDYCTVYICNMVDPGLAIFPTHRLIRCTTPVDWSRLGQHFEIEELQPATPEVAMERLRRLAARRATGFVIYSSGRALSARLRRFEDVERFIPADHPEHWRRLDYVVLHAAVIRGLLNVDDQDASGHGMGYTPDAHEAIERVNCGEFDAAILVNPPSLEDLRLVCMAGGRMPHKATYFYPKVVSGATIRSLTDF